MFNERVSMKKEALWTDVIQKEQTDSYFGEVEWREEKVKGKKRVW